MNTIDFSQTELLKMVSHGVGNKQREEELTISDEGADFDGDTSEHLLTYFLSSFKPEVYYEFAHSVSLEMNEVYDMVKKLFVSRADFLEISQQLAKRLYEHSEHPNIKEGVFHLVYFEGLVTGDELVNAVGIFKSESDEPFLKMNADGQKYTVDFEMGFDVKGLDKGCLIFNTDEESGYKVLIVDRARKSGDAQYWIDSFLRLQTCADDYHQTKDFLNITKTFVTEHLPEEFDMEKTDKIDLLNRSIGYFKENETFDKREFEEAVFRDNEIIDSFQQYKKSIDEDGNTKINDQFGISTQAVKKQSRVFKSVLKLDKNFHVYIHGDRSLIERGMENDGRKFYKIYYEDEQ